jgi:hypothetical protein
VATLMLILEAGERERLLFQNFSSNITYAGRPGIVSK